VKTYNSYGSNITGYDDGEDYIEVQFANGDTYTYTYESAGKDNVEQMKSLAESGGGLNSFINSVVKYDYSDKS
jgi:hypothetical protein